MKKIRIILTFLLVAVGLLGGYAFKPVHKKAKGPVTKLGLSVQITCGTTTTLTLPVSEVTNVTGEDLGDYGCNTPTSQICTVESASITQEGSNYIVPSGYTTQCGVFDAQP